MAPAALARDYREPVLDTVLAEPDRARLKDRPAADATEAVVAVLCRLAPDTRQALSSYASVSKRRVRCRYSKLQLG